MDKREKVARAIAYSGDVPEWQEWRELLPETRGHYLKQADAAIAALEPTDKPRVKPLVWRTENDRSIAADIGGFATYSIYQRDDGQFSLRMSWSLLMTDGVFETAEAAKAAANADYEARILAALEPVTDAPNWEGFGRDLLESWPVRDVDGLALFDAAMRNGLICEIPGGYDPEQHIDAEGICPETGDPWYEYAFSAAAAHQPVTVQAARVLLAQTPNPVFDVLKPTLIGEFSFHDLSHDQDGEEVIKEVMVPWNTTKQIISAALRALAAKDT